MSDWRTEFIIKGFDLVELVKKISGYVLIFFIKVLPCSAIIYAFRLGISLKAYSRFLKKI